MKQEITNDILLQKMNEQFEKIDKRFEKIEHQSKTMEKRFEKQFQTMDERFETMNEELHELTFFTKMGFDDLGQRVDENTRSIADLKETVGQTNDHLCQMELTMTQEFAASNMKHRRTALHLGHKTKKAS